jgi:selenocysteine-specific elongation factor
MKGFGTVVTGTLVAGTIHKEDELEIFPFGKRVRVRGVQVHGAAAEKAIAGQRTALNLTGVANEELSRGMILASPETFQTTSRFDARLSLLPSAKALKEGARVHFHAYTMETIAQVHLYGAKQLKPGEEGYAQFRLTEPTLLLPGDRFILRQFSPVITIGGGMVLDAMTLPKMKNVPAFLDRLDRSSPEAIVEARVARRGQKGLSFGQAVAETGWTRQSLIANLAPGLKKASIQRFGEMLIAGADFAKLTSSMTRAVSDFHKANPLVPGIGKQQLREKLQAGTAIFEAALEAAVREKKLEAAGETVRLPGHGVVMKDEEAESKKIIEYAFFSAGLKVPFLNEVLAGLKVDKTRAQKIVTLMLRDKVLVKISDQLVFHQSALNDLRSKIAALKASTRKIDVARFKDLTGVSRKYAIPLLEYLDRERVTRRVGDEREIL